MSVDKAVKRLNSDLSKLNHAKNAEKHGEANISKAKTSEKTALQGIATQEKAIIDQFGQSAATLDPATQQKLLTQLFGLGEKEVQTQDKFAKTLAADKTGLAKEKKSISAAHKHALKDLKPAEYHLGLKQTNRDRKELGLKAVKKAVRPPQSKGLSKAVSLATKAVELERSSGCYDYTQAFGARTNNGHGPTSRQGNGRITFDCSGFVGAVYKAAGLPSPYTVGYTGTSFDVAACKNMQKVSESQAKPGDVVVFPDHIALYIGHGNCISMGQEGDPKIVSVAAEAAYHNRGIQGFYHPRGA